MPEKDSAIVDWLLQLVPMLLIIGIGVLGGGLRYLNDMVHTRRKFKIADFILGLATSGFVSFMVFELCDYANFGWALTSVLGGMGGYMGAEALVLAKNLIIRRVNDGNCKTEVEWKETSTNHKED